MVLQFLFYFMENILEVISWWSCQVNFSLEMRRKWKKKKKILRLRKKIRPEESWIFVVINWNNYFHSLRYSGKQNVLSGLLRLTMYFIEGNVIYLNRRRNIFKTNLWVEMFDLYLFKFCPLDASLGWTLLCYKLQRKYQGVLQTWKT